MKYPKRSQYKYTKSRYRISNWPEYEAGLRSRGDLTVWLSDEALDAWRETPSGKPRRPAYLCRHRHRGRADDPYGLPSSASPDRGLPTLPGRDARGRSPDPRSHHIVSASEDTRRHSTLQATRPIDRSICSSTVQGSGFTSVTCRNRPGTGLGGSCTLLLMPNTSEIVASDLTARRTHDCTQVPALLEQIDDPIASVSADGAYDTKSVYEAAHERGEGRAVRVLIPPGRDAQLSPKPSAALQERDRNIRSIRELGRREWHTHSGYSKRSMVENTMYRYKTIIGRSMRSRTFDWTTS